MVQETLSSRRVVSELAVSLGCVRLIHQSWNDPIDRIGTTHRHHLELALLPRSEFSIASFPERWGPHRFEPIGELFLFPAGQTVRARSNCRMQNSIVCDLDPEAASEWIGKEFVWTDCRLEGGLDIASPSIRAALFRIGEEIRAPGFAGNALVELLAGQVAIELARHFMDIEDLRRHGGMSPWRLRLIDERLISGGPTPSLQELASLCGMSVRHLTRAFRASRGRSIGAYIAEQRVELAKQALAAGCSVKQVASDLGFTAASNFTAAFRRATGETPRAFRQRASRRIIDAPMGKQGRSSRIAPIDAGSARPC